MRSKIIVDVVVIHWHVAEEGCPGTTVGERVLYHEVGNVSITRENTSRNTSFVLVTTV